MHKIHFRNMRAPTLRETKVQNNGKKCVTTFYALAAA